MLCIPWENRFKNHQNFLPTVSMTPRDPTFFVRVPFLRFLVTTSVCTVCDVYICISFCYGFPLNRMGANNRVAWMIPLCYKGSSSVIDKKVCGHTISLIPRDSIPWFNWYRGIGPAVSLAPLNPLPLSCWDYEIFYKNGQVGSRGLIDNAESELF
jgi:hypothetical protein